jgi:hypothetical protein
MSTTSDENSALLQITLAEYAALRSEILYLFDRRDKLLGVNLSVVAASMALTLGQHANVLLLLLVPITSVAFGWKYVASARGVHRLSSYIQDVLHQHAVRLTGLQSCLSWEKTHHRYDLPGLFRHVPGVTLVIFLLPAVMALSATIAAAVVEPARHAEGRFAVVWPRLAWAFDAVATLSFAWFLWLNHRIAKARIEGMLLVPQSTDGPPE